MHTIRLRGPWEAKFLSEADAEPTPRTVELPTAWGDLLPNGGRAFLLRRFGQPTGVEPGDRVMLVVEAAGVELRVRLNGAELGSVSPEEAGRYDVAGRLLPRNELSLATVVPAPPGDNILQSLVGQVRLEIG